MSALRYAALIRGSGFQFQMSPLFARGDEPPPSRERGSANNDASSNPLYLHAGPQTSKPKPQKQSKARSVCIYLHGICDHQADQGVCCCCNGPIVLCLRSRSYLHYTFYKHTKKRRHISGEDEGSWCVFIFEDHFLAYTYTP